MKYLKEYSNSIEEIIKDIFDDAEIDADVYEIPQSRFLRKTRKYEVFISNNSQNIKFIESLAKLTNPNSSLSWKLISKKPIIMRICKLCDLEFDYWDEVTEEVGDDSGGIYIQFKSK